MSQELDLGTVTAKIKGDPTSFHAASQAVRKDVEEVSKTTKKAAKERATAANEAAKAEAAAAKEATKAARDAANEQKRIAREKAQAEKQAADEMKQAWQGLALASGASFAAISAGVWKAVNDNMQLKASMMGLDSVATGTVGSYEKIKAKLEQVREEGVIPLSNAINAYKNLLKRYEDEDTAIKMFESIADMAAFNKQAHLTLGQAVESTTEGLKNELSTLSDAGGMTKNISVMWKEYAAQIGKTVGQLTDAEKRQAEVNGTLEEGKYSAGDLAKLQNSMAGALAKTSAEALETSTVMGDALEPATSAVATAFGALLGGVKNIIKENPELAAGLTASALALTGLTGAAAGWNLVQPQLIAGFKFLFTSPWGLAIMGIAALAGALTTLYTASKKAHEEMENAPKAAKAEVYAADKLIERLEYLKKKTKLTNDEKAEMIRLSNELADIIPNAVEGYDAEENAIINLSAAYRELVLLKREELELSRKDINKDLKKARKDRNRIDDQLEANQRDLDEFLSRSATVEYAREHGKLSPEQQKTLNDIMRVRRELQKKRDEINQDINGYHSQIDFIDETLSKDISPKAIREERKKNSKPTGKTKNGDGGGDDKRSPYQAARDQYEADVYANQWSLEEQRKYWEERVGIVKKSAKEEDDYKKKLAKLDNELADAQKKASDQLALQRATGRDKELMALDQAMEVELKTVGAGSQRENDIRERYRLQRDEINKRWDAETLAQQKELQAAMMHEAGNYEQEALLREEARYAREISDTKLTKEQLETLEKEHQQNIIDIKNEYANKRADADLKVREAEINGKIAVLENQKKTNELTYDEATARSMNLAIDRKIAALQIQLLNLKIAQLKAQKEQVKSKEEEAALTAQILELETARDNITFEIDNQALDQMKELRDAWSDTMNDLAKGTKDFGDVWDEIMDRLRKKFFDTLFDMIMESQSSNVLQQILGFVFGIGGGVSGGGGGGMSGLNYTPKMGGYFHNGGIIEPLKISKAHVGMLVSGLKRDEVPIIAQTGEEVLSRADRSEVLTGIRSLLAQQGQTQQTVIQIQAVDAASFAELTKRYPEAIIGPLVGDFNGNGVTRKLFGGGRRNG